LAQDQEHFVEDPFQREVTARLGLMPNFFCSALAAEGLIEGLWAFAKAAYLDSPLPSLFKERLFVHLSRFCAVRYCVVRHVGFLIGKGRPAGDPAAKPERIDDVIALLRRPLPDGRALEASLRRMRTLSQPVAIPAPRSAAEADLFAALTVMFLEPLRAGDAREAVRRAAGDAEFEILTAYLAFVRTAHYWTENHPDLAYDPDMVQVIAENPTLRELLLNTDEARSVRAASQLRSAVNDLHST
jgi:hypothetical protein